MKIVFIVAPRASGEVERHGLPFLNVAYLAGSVLLDGHQARIVDAHNFDLNIDEAAQAALALSPEVVAITASTHNRFSAIGVAKKIKSQMPQIKIVVGGPHFGLTAVDALTVVPEIDYVIKGEGEITLRELLKTNFAMEKLAAVLGLVYRDSQGMIKVNSDRPFIQNLDELPRPAWHLFDLEKYQGSTPVEPTGLKTIGLASSRGCPSQCIFCASIALHKGRLRFYSPKKFVDEIQYLHDHYGYRAFNFWDDTFSVNRQHAVDICNEIISRGLKIYWYTPNRVNTVDPELLILMKRAGCTRINFGVESGSPRMLKLIKKNITIDQVRQAVKWSLAAGLEVTLNFLMVYPYETWEDIAFTVAAIKEFKALKNCYPSHSFIIVYPGTELEMIAKKEGIMPRDFSWNSPYINDKQSIAGEDPSVFYFEWPGLPFAEVKAFVLKELNTKNELWQKLFFKVKKIKNPADALTLLKISFNYLKYSHRRPPSGPPKITYIANARIPTEKAHGLQIVKMCEAFAISGAVVKLLIPRRLNPIKKDPFEYYQAEKNFKIVALPCLDLFFADKYLGNLCFWLETFTFLLSARIYKLFQPGGLVYTREQLAGWFFARPAIELHLLPARIKKWHLGLWRRAAKLVVLTSAMKNILVGQGIDAKKIFVAPDAVDLKEFDFNLSVEAARQKLNLPLDKKIAMYTGSFYLYDWKGVEVLLQAAARLGQDSLVVLVGGRAEEIEKIKSQFSSTNLLLVGAVPHSQIPLYLKAADVLVLPNKKGDIASESYTSPLKLFEYLAAGRPIVASDLPSLKEILNENNSLLVEPNDPEKLADGISKLFNNPALAERLSRQGLSDIKSHTWQKRAERILQFISA